MAWNQPGNKGENPNPWGGGGNKGGNPPGLDDLLKKLNGLFGGGSGLEHQNSHVDIVFANESEIKSLYQTQNFDGAVGGAGNLVSALSVATTRTRATPAPSTTWARCSPFRWRGVPPCWSARQQDRAMSSWCANTQSVFRSCSCLSAS